MVLVLIVLIFFLVSFRAAIIVALTIPLSLLFAFIVLHAHDVAANLLSIGAIDFGIVIDGTVVMIENIYRELASARRTGIQAERGNSCSRERCGSPDLLFRRGHPRRIPSDLRAQWTGRKIVSSDGRNHVVRAGRRAHPHSDA